MEEFDGGSEDFGGHAVEAAIGREESVCGAPILNEQTLHERNLFRIWNENNARSPGKSSKENWRPDWIVPNRSPPGHQETSLIRVASETSIQDWFQFSIS